MDVVGLGLSDITSASNRKNRENISGLAKYQARKIKMDSAKLGEPTWPDLVSGQHGRDELGWRFEVQIAQGHLDSLADCMTTEVLKKGCEKCKGQNSGFKSLREL